MQVVRSAVDARLAVHGDGRRATSLQLGGSTVEAALHADRDLQPRSSADMYGMGGVDTRQESRPARAM